MMKISKIYPKEWMAVHPYKQSAAEDLYYTDIANEVYQACNKNGLNEIGMSDEQVRSISVRITAYFEDVISGLNIWHSFIQEYKRCFGKYLPFYSTGDNYFDDEVNEADVRFLLWHFSQQYFGLEHGAFINPDNSLLNIVGGEINNIFNDNWEVAPENSLFKAMFSPSTRYQTEEDYQNVLLWMHYNSYLTVNSEEEVVRLYSDYVENTPDKKGSYENYITLRFGMAHYGRTPFLAYTTPKWLALIFPEDHPDYPLFKACAEKYEMYMDKEQKFDPVTAKDLYDKFVSVSGENLFVYESSKQELVDFLNDKLGIKELPGIDMKSLKDKCAIYALPDSGVQIISNGVEFIKDPKNPFYDPKTAQSGAVLFFTHTLCPFALLEKMQALGMLDDAQIRSNESLERGKAIIQDDWQFVVSYFQRLHEKE